MPRLLTTLPSADDRCLLPPTLPSSDDVARLPTTLPSADDVARLPTILPSADDVAIEMGCIINHGQLGREPVFSFRLSTYSCHGIAANCCVVAAKLEPCSQTDCDIPS